MKQCDNCTMFCFPSLKRVLEFLTRLITIIYYFPSNFLHFFSPTKFSCLNISVFGIIFCQLFQPYQFVVIFLGRKSCMKRISEQISLSNGKLSNNVCGHKNCGPEAINYWNNLNKQKHYKYLVHGTFCCCCRLRVIFGLNIFAKMLQESEIKVNN